MPSSTLSIRLLWPFFRLRADQDGLNDLTEMGVDLRSIADPDTRISHALAMQLLERAVDRTGDYTLGLRAAQNLEPGDLGALEYAARSCGTLRSALECMRRYMALVNDAIAPSLEESGTSAVWRLPVTDGVKQHPCANDFQLACGVLLSRRLTGSDPALLEVHFAHAEPTSMPDYERLFDCRLRFDMPMNALVFRRSRLDTPLRLANPGLQAAYAMHAEEELRRLEHNRDTASRVRSILLDRLRTGAIGMPVVARSLAMSTATLRRKLDREGTTLSALLDEVRRDLAAKYLRDQTLSISEVAFLLGFANVSAFYKAFQRWHPGRTPADFRREPPPR